MEYNFYIVLTIACFVAMYLGKTTIYNVKADSMYFYHYSRWKDKQNSISQILWLIFYIVLWLSFPFTIYWYIQYKTENYIEFSNTLFIFLLGISFFLGRVVKYTYNKITWYQWRKKYPPRYSSDLTAGQYRYRITVRYDE